MFIQLVLAHGNVYDIWEQPPAVPFVRDNGKSAQHFFDFLITWMDGSTTAYAVKPFELVQRRSFDTEVALIASQTPKSFADEVRLFTDAGFRRYEAVNASRFHQFSKSPDVEADAAVTAQIQTLTEPTTIGDIVEQTGLAGRAYRAAVCAIFRGDLVQVKGGLIDYPTVVKRGAMPC
jgi:hypothetical protein